MPEVFRKLLHILNDDKRLIKRFWWPRIMIVAGRRIEGQEKRRDPDLHWGRQVFQTCALLPELSRRWKYSQPRSPSIIVVEKTRCQSRRWMIFV